MAGVLRKRSEHAASAAAVSPGLVRRVHRAARRTIRLRLSEGDLAPIGEDIDRLLLEADDLALTPQSRNLLLALDDEISQGLAASGADDPAEHDEPDKLET